MNFEKKYILTPDYPLFQMSNAFWTPVTILLCIYYNALSPKFSYLFYLAARKVSFTGNKPKNWHAGLLLCSSIFCISETCNLSECSPIIKFLFKLDTRRLIWYLLVIAQLVLYSFSFYSQFYVHCQLFNNKQQANIQNTTLWP